jgi:hypothetical protein
MSPERIHSSMTHRHLAIAGLLILIVSVALLTVAFDKGKDGVGLQPEVPLPSYSIETFSPHMNERDEVVSRLQEIMRIRDSAYRSRSLEMLSTVYSSDCPCLSSDKRAIKELRAQHLVWEGISTSIDARSETRVNNRVWIINALFRFDAIRVKTESGSLVRTEPSGIDLLRFALVRPSNTHSWVLGVVSILEGP